MRKPKWVLFDYGETLACETAFDDRAGYEAVLRLAYRNPNGATVDDILSCTRGLYAGVFQRAREQGVEVHSPHVVRLIFETLGIEFHCTYEEIDDVFWDAASPCVPSPHMEEFLAFLNDEGIRTGVISNIGFSGASLRRRLDKLLPTNDFSFVIASSDYVVRKPSPLIFRLALAKAGAKAEDVWYVGDNAYADIGGAASAGILPVWYRSGLTSCWPSDARSEETPSVPHIHVTDIMELACIIRGV